MTRSLPTDQDDAGAGRSSVNTPAPATGGWRATGPSYVRPVLGLMTVAAMIGVIAAALVLFAGGVTPTAPVVVLSPRAGLVMNPDAKVKMRGVQVGKVASIESQPDGQAALHLAMDPAQLPLIPANVLVDITSSTVFGAKFVQLVTPAEPAVQTLRAGQVLTGEHVTVEPNTVFERLTSVLSKIQPVQLNQTLGALASGFNDRGEKIGRALSDFDALLTRLDSSRPTLTHELSVAPEVLTAYADAAPDLVKTADNVIPVSQTVIDERDNLDAVLLSTIGMADTGNAVLGANRRPLTDAMHLATPTTDLLNDYHEALTCGVGGLTVMAKEPPAQKPGINLSIGLDFGTERYRYPQDLPRVAATGGPWCVDLPELPPGAHPPFVVADVGSNPFQYGNHRLVWDSDLIKQWLFGPIDGPPRNPAQITGPG